MARGVGGQLFEEGNNFKYFHQRGVVILGRLQLIEGHLLIIWGNNFGTCNLVPKQKKSRPQFKFLGNSDSVGKSSGLESLTV